MLPRVARLAVMALGSTSAACVCAAPPAEDPPLAVPFLETFDDGLGPEWRATSDSAFRVEEGVLTVANAHNHPLWLARRLPRDVRIEFSVRSDSPEGDIKCEIFGDGRSAAVEASYTATSYVWIFGGWGNQLDVLARLDEHGADRVERPTRRVEPGRWYRVRIERRGQRLESWLDGEPFLALDDPNPLEGPGHEHFAFNDWESALSIDDLRIEALP